MATAALMAPHALTVFEVCDLAGTSLATGLSRDEARRRIEQHGPNVLPSGGGRARWRILLDQFRSPLIYVLMAAALATVVIGHAIDALVIMGVLLVNAVIGFAQEARASTVLEALASLVVVPARVTRGGHDTHVQACDLVPGDLVSVESGDRVPADLRLVEAHDMRVDEASLTGESLPVHKSIGAIDASTPLADRTCMAYTGSMVTGGRGRGVVVATGPDTEVGVIQALMASTTAIETPLTRQLAHFSRLITVLILCLAAGTFALGLARGEPFAYMVTAAVALAVGAIPEGLPAVVTITLAIGVSRMAKRGAVIRRLPAVETLGSVTVICTDKTGTLTENRMTVQSVFCAGGWYPIGPGPVPASVVSCLLAGVLCNDARLGCTGADTGSGDPTELALLDAASRACPEVVEQAKRMTRVQELPFSSDLRLMATVHVQADHPHALLTVKGAVEEVIALCPLDGDDRSTAERAAAEAGDEALRVIAVGALSVPRDFVLSLETLRASSLRFLGLQALQDPPRPAAIAAIQTCHTAGIDVVMITGDHERTARAVARQVGIAESQVFSRVTAEEKLEIVRSLQGQGHVVAMTGDGVNDAPALKQADIGLAMGLSGTEVAKQAADMVIVDDDFATIESAVEEGRTVFDNLVKFIVWTLPTNFAEGLIVLVAVGFNLALPVLPLQILWINTVTAVSLGVMLAFEPAEPDIMRRSPRVPGTPLLSRALMVRVVAVGATMLLATFAAFIAAVRLDLPMEEARAIAVNALVAMEVSYLLACRSLRGSLRSIGPFSNPWIWAGIATTIVLQAVLTYVPAMNEVFGTAPVGWVGWILVILPSPLVYGLAALLKKMPYGPTSRPGPAPRSALRRPRRRQRSP